MNTNTGTPHLTALSQGTLKQIDYPQCVVTKLAAYHYAVGTMPQFDMSQRTLINKISVVSYDNNEQRDAEGGGPSSYDFYKDCRKAQFIV